MFNNKDPDYCQYWPKAKNGYALDPKTFDYTPNITIQDIWNKTYPPDKGATLQVDGTIEVQGRDLLKELDEMRDAMLLLNRDVSMEEKYPELKEAYDDYMELYRSIKIADKLAKTGDT